MDLRLPDTHGFRTTQDRPGIDRVQLPLQTYLWLMIAWCSTIQGARGEAPVGPEPVFSLTQKKPCGVYSLYVAGRMLGSEATLARVSAPLPTDGNGTNSLDQLASAAQEVGLYPVPARLTVDQLADFSGPAIVHVRHSADHAEGVHFVVYLGQNRGRTVSCLEPPASPAELSIDEFRRLSTGYCLFLFRDEPARRSFVDSLAQQYEQEYSRSVGWPVVCLLVACNVYLSYSFIKLK